MSSIKLPLEGNQVLIFCTSTGLQVAKGYSRVVVGERGPYVEFENNHIFRSNIKIPDSQKWRLTHQHAYYDEYRTVDEAYVKLYFQKRCVNYADYKIGKWYISPDDLFVGGMRCKV